MKNLLFSLVTLMSFSAYAEITNYDCSKGKSTLKLKVDSETFEVKASSLTLFDGDTRLTAVIGEQNKDETRKSDIMNRISFKDGSIDSILITKFPGKPATVSVYQNADVIEKDNSTIKVVNAGVLMRCK